MDLILFGLLASKKVTGEEQQKVPLALNQDCRQRWFPLYSEEKSVLHIPHGFRMKAVMYFTLRALFASCPIAKMTPQPSARLGLIIRATCLS